MIRRARRPLLSLVATLLLCPHARADGKPAPAAAPACRAYNGGSCCAPAVTAHLPREAVFASCGESDATFLGEQGGKDSCKYFFAVKDGKGDDNVVQVYVPITKEPMTEPNDPFFEWKKVGRAWFTAKGSSPKSAPLLNSTTGLWFGGKGYMVTVNAATKVCTKAETLKLAARIK